MATHTLLTNEPLDVGQINNLVIDDTCGAVSLFVGTTRDNFNDKKVLSLQYEAYEPMALKQMNLICSDLRAQWPDVRHIAIHHRLGHVPVRESSVVIAISSPHRQTALAAVSYAIDELKKRVPIFKKEQYENGDADWKENKECPWLSKEKNNSMNYEKAKDSESDYIRKNLVQITAKDDEIHRRIQCFINKKREEINQSNITDFMHTNEATDQSTGLQVAEFENSCARAYSYIVKQEHSKGHLRVRRVDNGTGPQTRPNYSQEIDKLMRMKSEKKPNPIKCDLITNCKNEQLSARLKTIEGYIGVSPLESRDMFERIKALESRILYLESLSPEYRHFLDLDGEKFKSVTATQRQSSESGSNCIIEKKCTKRKSYTVQELNNIIKNIDSKLKKSLNQT